MRNKSKFIECEKSIKNVFVNMLKTIYYKYGNYNIAYLRIITSKTLIDSDNWDHNTFISEYS